MGGNPAVVSVSDNAVAGSSNNGTITTTVDWIARVVSSTDVWNKSTTTTYDQVGRVTSTTGPAGTQELTYSPEGRLNTQKLDGQVGAQPTYDTASGVMTGVTYPAGTGNGGNGTSGTFAFDTRGRLVTITWKDPSQAMITSDAVTRSAAGRVTDESIDGADPYPTGANFSYDGAGRLTSAQVPGHAITYDFAGSAGCGALATAGANTNRTSMVDNSVTTTYCYDEVDRLTSTTATGLGTIAYDAHGNTTTLGAETFKYDGADRHVESTASGTTVRYVRDATGRIVARTVTGAQNQTQRYSFGGGGDSPSVVLDTNNQVVESTIGLPGGVSVTKRSGSEVWSYPNVHGDVAALANSTGAKQGSTFTYDPYGNALAGLPDNSDGSLDYGWLGRHQRGLEHATDLQPIIEMGARQYHPLLGRFLETDPIEGGSANDYDYVDADPINGLDLQGTVNCTKPANKNKPICKRTKASTKRVMDAAGPTATWKMSVAPSPSPVVPKSFPPIESRFPDARDAAILRVRTVYISSWDDGLPFARTRCVISLALDVTRSSSVLATAGRGCALSVVSSALEDSDPSLAGGGRFLRAARL